MTRIKEICKERGIKLKDLAKMIGVSSAYMTKIIKGESQLYRYQEIADKLGISLVDLLEQEPVEHYQRRGNKERRLIPGEWEKR